MESMVKKLKRKLRSSRKKKEEKLFLEKGSIFLKKLIADCNGKSISIRNFSSSQIRKATNNFDYRCLLHWSWDQEWYKGIVEDKPYLIKKFSTYEDDEYVFNDIVLCARMSNHNNFLKLIGCCFEFSPAVVVFEYEELASLYEKGRVFSHESKVLTWSVRLKIAKEIAVAVTYLHTAFPKTIIHKTINPTKIFLDKNWKAKLIDFRFSVSVPEGKSKIQDDKVSGMYVYTDPLYYDTRTVSEYTDVYSLGLCLLVFLTAKPPHDSFEPDVNMYTNPRSMISYVKSLYENGKFDEVIDEMIAKDITSIQKLQVEAFLVLALRCCEEREEDRPKMIQVAKEIKGIERIEESLDASSTI